MKQLRIIVSSTRPGRIGPKVAEWVATQAPADEWEVKGLDPSGLPFLDEEEHPKSGNYALPHTLQWASEIFESDAIVVVTPQYNRSFPAPIKNAIDILFAEWDSKPIAILGYGWSGGTDAAADLAKVLTHVKADVVGTTGLHFLKDLSPEGEVDATEQRRGELSALLEALSSRLDERASVSA